MSTREYLKWILRACSFVLLISAFQSQARAQGTATGSIHGSITDGSAASVGGATVTITDVATGRKQSLTTQDDGEYNAPNLAIGIYTVEVAKTGFNTEVHQNVQVSVGESTVLDITMKPGQEVQSVTVEAQNVAITEDKGDRTVLIQEKVLNELPLQISSGPRLDDTFLTLAPGVTGNTFVARINGAPDFNQDFYYDGIPYMNADGGGRQEGGGPPVDAIDQYTIVTNGYSATYGRSSGLLNFHIKSGTNQLHGGAWEYLRNNVLDSRGYFSATAGTEKQNEWGFRVGGPVYIPKLYDGRNKSFFFALMDWYSFRGGVSTSLTTLPTPQMTTGNFSQLPFPIYDPLTTRPDGGGGFTRDAFPGNIIPMNRLSPLSAQYLALMPTATLPGIVNNAVLEAPTAPINNKYWLVKGDQNVRQKFVIHGSYYRIKQVEPTSPQISGPLGSGNNFLVNDWEPRFSLDQTYTPTVLNQTLFSFQYTEGVRIFFPLVPSTFTTNISTPGLPYPAINIAGLPQFGAGLNNNQNSGGCWPCYFFADTLRFQHGKHQFSAGTELRWEDERDAFAVNIGTFNFTNGNTSLPDSPNFGTLGNSFASFYLGSLNQTSRTGVANNRLVKTGYKAFFFQDDFKASSKLTLTAGLRWDYSTPVSAPDNSFSSFEPGPTNPAAGGLPGSLIYAGHSGGACIPQGGASLCNPRFANTYYNGWQPRVGFAYQVNPLTVVRGGFGMDTIRGGATSLMGPEVAAAFLTGFQYQDTLISPDTFSPPPQLAPTWDVGPLPPIPPIPARTRDLANGQALQYMQPQDGKNGIVQQWSLTVERQLPYRIALETSYVGTSSSHIGANLLNENQVPSQYLALGPLLYDDINGPAAAAAGLKPPYPGFTGSVQQALRPFPQFLTITANTQTPGHSTYNGLQMRLQKTYSEGLSFLVSYTFSKNITDGIDQFSTFGAMPLDTAQRYRERQVLGANANGAGGPQVLSMAGTYELPIGPGKRFLNSGGAIGRLTGGWNVAPLLTYDSGVALPISGGSVNPIFNGQSRPNVVPNVPLKVGWSGKFKPATDYYLNPAAFSDAGPFALGNAPPTLPRARTFAYYNENIAIIKNTKLWESAVFQFRCDFFNAFNRVVFASPDTNYSDIATGGFGKIGAQSNTPRVIQFGARIDF